MLEAVLFDSIHGILVEFIEFFSDLVARVCEFIDSFGEDVS